MKGFVPVEFCENILSDLFVTVLILDSLLVSLCSS